MYEKNEYFKCFRFIFHLMKVFGIFPFIFTHQGTTRYLFFSRTMTGIILVMYFSLVPVHWSIFVENSKKIFFNFNPATFVRFLPIVVFRLLFFAMPFISWKRSMQLHAYWKNWWKFQSKMEAMTRPKFISKVKKKIQWINFYGLVGPMLVSSWLKYKLTRNSMPIIPTVPAFIYMVTFALSIVIYWYTNCLFMKSTAKDLLDLIKRTIERQEEEVMCNLMHLWLHLCDLNDEFSSAHSTLFLIFLSFSVVNMVAALYSFSYVLTFDPDKSNSFAFLIFALQCAGVLLIFSESADSVFRHIVPQVQQILLRQDTAMMNVKFLRQMLTFLQVTEARKFTITLNGFMVINRSTIVTIFAITINYLIVLKQFST